MAHRSKTRADAPARAATKRGVPRAGKNIKHVYRVDVWPAGAPRRAKARELAGTELYAQEHATVKRKAERAQRDLLREAGPGAFADLFVKIAGAKSETLVRQLDNVGGRLVVRET